MTCAVTLLLLHLVTVLVNSRLLWQPDLRAPGVPCCSGPRRCHQPAPNKTHSNGLGWLCRLGVSTGMLPVTGNETWQQRFRRINIFQTFNIYQAGEYGALLFLCLLFPVHEN